MRREEREVCVWGGERKESGLVGVVSCAGILNSPLHPPHHTGIGIVASNRLVRLAHSVPNIALPPDLHCIRTVGDMKRLVERCAHDKPLDTAVRNALSLARSVWGKAKQAVVAAVEPDSR